MTKKSDAPAIRFKGFSDAWEQRKVGDLLIERNQQAPMSDEYPLMAFIANEGVAPKGERYDRSALVTDTVNKLYKKTEKGDFIYSSNNLETGSIGLNKYGKACISPVYSIFEPTGIADSDFLGRRLVRKDFINAMVKWRQGVIYGQWRIHESDFLKIEITVPSVEEQRKIGTYLDQLDHLITLHQRKFEKLTNVKKSMLEKMFPQNGSSYPEIRFKGFTDPWEQRKLGEVVERITRKNENLESTLPLTISAQYGLINQNEFFDKRIASKDVSGYFLVRNGEFAYNKSTSSDAPWGAIKRLDSYESGVLSTLYIVFKILDERKTSSDYIVTYYNTDLWHKGIQAIAAEGARNHGLLNVAPADFFETNLTMPKDYAEQQQIGSFFQMLDHLITLHQRKFDKLQVLKKAMLEKMFPKNGSSVPEIRFKGFTDAWEQRKLGEILQERNTRTSDFESNPLYSLTIESGVTPKTDRYERSSLVTKTEDLFKTVKPNEFVTNPMNLRFGALGYNKNAFTVSVSGYYDVFSIDDDKCSGFWNAYFKTPTAMNIFDNAATGSLIEKRRVKYSTLQQLAFYMPNDLSEKAEIGKYMDTFDHLITLHQRELEKLQNIKKSMLEKMFV